MWHAASQMRARSLRVVGLIAGVAILAGLAPFAFAQSQSQSRSRSRAPAPWLRLVPSSGPAGTWVRVRGADFRPRGRGIVLLGSRRVASFRATRRGTFRAGFVVPGGAGGVLRVAVVQAARGTRGVVRRFDRAGSSFRVLVGGPPADVVPGVAPAGSAGGAGSAPGDGSPGGGGGATPAAPATKAPPSTGGGTGGGGSTGGGSTGGGSAGGGSTGGSTGGGSGSGGGSAGSWWVPPKDLTWYWQIQGTVNNAEPVAAYDIDGFGNTASEVATLHAKGIHVICYIDVGTWEEWRSDAGSFPASVIGNSNGWPGEKYLNIADTSVLEPIMTKRFQMCKAKGFDAVEPDNIEDNAEQNTGFTITAGEQLTYDEWVAGEVHALGMAVLQKNDGEQTSSLESHFDGALTEQCNQYSECDNFDAYLTAGKPVLNAEYERTTSEFCAADNAAGIMGARYDLELDGKTFEPCW